jgi:hypothetical protein
MFAAKSNSNRNFRKLSFQNLESRQLMAGNVAVQVTSGGDLLVQGDTLGNDVAIVQSVTQGQADPGRFFVTGLNGTTINGLASGNYFQGVNRDVIINLGAGSDHVTLGDGVSDFHFNVPNDLRISMGEGANRVNINGITVRDDATITSGAGLDTVDIHGARIGVAGGVDGGLNDFTINTGNGTDVVRMRNFFARHNLNINAGGLTDVGRDLVDLAIGDVGNDIIISTGGGRDTVLTDTVGANHLNVNTGADADGVRITNTNPTELNVNLGAGTDTLAISHTFGLHAQLNGGDGALDRVFEHDVVFDNGQSLVGFEPNVIQNL